MIELLGPIAAVYIARRWADKSWIWLAGFMIFGLGDLVITYHMANTRPWMEGNPIVRPFLAYDGGLVVGSFLWTLGWLWVYSKSPIKWPIALGLTLGHLWGWTTWQRYWTPEMFLEMAIGSAAIIALVYPYVLSHNGRPPQEQPPQKDA